MQKRRTSVPATKRADSVHLLFRKLHRENKQWKDDINTSIGMLMKEIGKLYDANERWKDEILTKTSAEIDAFNVRIKRFIDVKNELLVHDIVAAMKDDVQGVKDDVADHEFRIQVLEHKR